MTETYQGRDCGDASGNAMCTRPAGHPGAHYDATIGLTWTADDPPAGLLPRVDELTARIRELSVKFTELASLAAPSEDGALNLGHDATIRSAVAGISTQIDAMTAVFSELREAVDSGQLDAVDAALKCVGLGFDTRVNDIGDLAGQRDSHAEHAKNCEDALARIADMARKALGTTGDYRFALTGILAITQENDR